jgi:hypothetical protein
MHKISLTKLNISLENFFKLGFNPLKLSMSDYVYQKFKISDSCITLPIDDGMFVE